MSSITSFITGRIKSIKYAINGAIKLATTEHSIIVQLGVSCIAVAFGMYFEISKTEWLFQTLAIGLVIAIEGLNTAVEAIADFIHPDYNEKIGLIKDIAAGAVFFAAISAIIIAAIIYVPYINELIN